MDHPERARRRSCRVAAGWIVIVVLASLVDPAVVLASLVDPAVVLAPFVDPAVVLGSPSGSEATTAAGGGPLGADVFTVSHLFAYGVLAWLLVGGIDGEFEADRATTVRIVLASVLLAWAVGVGVELLQAPLAARTASVTDALVNGLGAIAGGGLWTVVRG